MSQTTLRRPSTVADAGLIRRRRRLHSRRGLAVRLGIGLLLVALVAGLTWLVGFSPVLAVKQVRVTGVQLLTSQQVQTAAAVPVGVPMARQDLDAVAARVRALKPVESVIVSRSWPSTVRIAVTERTAVYAAGRQGSYVMVDRHGVPFQVVSDPGKRLVVDVDPMADQQLLADLGVVVSALPRSVAKKVDKITADSPDTIRLLLENGSVVVWGSAEQSGLKAQVAKALLKRRASVYDVSAPAYPTTR
ncbi:hypothetical protein GCM10009841_16490 [Microlunatus panaciterrae]|uniref:Cell division protein FtsQ n=1 Tax=Microlunatus panaciterrae TaxID=400768 RepID=A0ABS2RNH5_9ACTN|nr:FtsQ-type POTRA domain-containing protein [Microlunatus panaciterrae]MBM7800208.1 cell division protein FtsQ [Microlunatus panaciterrae]